MILRPEPGNAATAERVRSARLKPLILPLFAVRPLPWTPPDPTGFDGLLLTSASAIRHGGEGLDVLRRLPVLAVGPVTAEAARARGFGVACTGSSDIAELLAATTRFHRLLWLAGRERTPFVHPTIAAVAAVYASDPLPLDAAQAEALRGSVALVHSARAGARLAHELDRHGISRTAVGIAAISGKAAEAAGSGWRAIAIAARPDDEALIAAARPLAIDP